jgi:hypothetical protein
MDTRPSGNPGAVALPRPEPSAPVVDILFGVRLHRYGIDAHSGRNTGRLALAAELPASVLADLTGISISTAKRWSHWAKRDWAACPRPPHSRPSRQDLPEQRTCGYGEKAAS